jgi:molybdate transport system substrate-binding protein
MLARRTFLAATLVALGGCLAGCKRNGEDGHVAVTVAAAASLRSVMPVLIEAFQKEHPRIRISAAYGASGDLRKRVVDGAPVDAVLLANAQPVDSLIASGHIEPESRKVVATNDLILIAPKGASSTLTFATLEQLPADEKLAIGDPGAVPAGQYARDALKKLGKWDGVESRLVLGGDVSAVLAYARRGEVAAAIVYGTEIRGIDDVVQLDRAKGDWAPSPEVVQGLIKTAEHKKQAERFLEFVASPAGEAIFERYGFGKP